MNALKSVARTQRVKLFLTNAELLNVELVIVFYFQIIEILFYSWKIYISKIDWLIY